MGGHGRGRIGMLSTSALFECRNGEGGGWLVVGWPWACAWVQCWVLWAVDTKVQASPITSSREGSFLGHEHQAEQHAWKTVDS